MQRILISYDHRLLIPIQRNLYQANLLTRSGMQRGQIACINNRPLRSENIKKVIKTIK